MEIPLLEQLARLLAQGRREAQRLVGAAGGRYRERAVLQESVRAPDGGSRAPHRMLCGDPALALAALLAERRGHRGAPFQGVCVDLAAAQDDVPWVGRIARWIPRLCLLQALAPDAVGCFRAPPEQHALLRLVLDATWPGATIGDAASPLPPGGSMLLLADDATRLIAAMRSLDTRPDTHWTACVPDAAMAADVRRALLASHAGFDVESVGAAPAEWARRHVGGKGIDAMHAALAAFGATPLAQAQSMDLPGPRRAGTEVLLGECVRDGLRTLVWVDAPDRRTSDATLCRAITRRDVEARWDGVVVLGWHFASTFAQHLALRCDGRLEAFAIDLPPRTSHRNPRLVAPTFRPIGGLASAWIHRTGARAQGQETVSVQWCDPASHAPIADWSIDPDHDGEVFRGAWHAARDGHPAQRAVRLQLPWRAGPRRVCIRAFDAAGHGSEVVMVVRHRSDTARDAAPHAPPATPHARTEALC